MLQQKYVAMSVHLCAKLSFATTAVTNILHCGLLSYYGRGGRSGGGTSGGIALANMFAAAAVSA